MAKPKPVASELGQLPTFSDLDCSPFWDADEKAPWPQTATDMLDDELREEYAKPWLAAYDTWRLTQSKPAEAPARAAYVDRVARHLIGVYPGVRIAPDAYAAAMVEDLSSFSADVVRLAAQRSRRTCKTLPTIAHMLEACQVEVGQRQAIAGTLRRAIAEYEAAIAKGSAEADSIAVRVSTTAPDLTVSAVRTLFDDLCGSPLGFAPEGSDKREARDAVRTALRLAEQGDGDAARLLCAAATELASLSQRVATSDDDAWFAASTARRESAAAFRALLVEFATKRRQHPSEARQTQSSEPAIYAAGDRVCHAKFGPGVVEAVDGPRIDVIFAAPHGPRRLLAAFLTRTDEPGMPSELRDPIQA